ncbi:MAG: helix-turn-helix domain-containing protein [Bacteroidetes bacterium]|nr:helix-turn-helix domain-containing protein [Bacteroidota bacterium]
MDNKTPFLIPMSQEELWEKMRQLIRTELADMKKEKLYDRVEFSVTGFTQKPIFKSEEVCKLLQVSRQTLHQWAKEGVLKPYKIKSRVFYLWADIEGLIKNE